LASFWQRWEFVSTRLQTIKETNHD